MKSKNILLGVSGSISAYKACDIVSGLNKLGHQVKVILTDGGAQFITPMALQVLSKHPVYTDMWNESDPTSIMHIDLPKWADIFVIAPATANIIGKVANGIADDLLSATALVAQSQCHKLIAPAMNTHMYDSPAVQRNVQTLRELRYQVIEPREALLACGDYGQGALATVPDILNVIQQIK